MTILDLFINKNVTVIYIENGETKKAVGKLIDVDSYKAITLKCDNLNVRLGFISNFSAIKVIRYRNIPIYHNKYLPPKYGYNPLYLADNSNEKNKIFTKKFGKKINK